MKKIIFTFCFGLIGGIGLLTTNVQAKEIKICDDDGGWPPYTYADPKNKENVIGAATDIVKEILKRAGNVGKVTLMPWKRCLGEVESGASSMLINASYNDERAKKYLVSKPYYTIASGLVYLSSKFPQKPEIKTVDEMKKYKYCGLLGYNYDMYKLPAENLDMQAKDEDQRFKKLRAGRCDFILADLEILKGFVKMGQVNMDGTDSIPIPESKPKEFHMLISRAESAGEPLLKTLDEGLEKLKADGTYTKIFTNYGL